MNPVSAMMLSGGVVLLGRWAEDKELTSRIVIATAFAAIMLSALGQYDIDFAGQFATLILVGVLLRYGVPIIQKTGLA